MTNFKQLQDYAVKKRSPSVVHKYQFDEIVTKSLLLHPGRLEKFKVRIPNFSSMSTVPDVNKWILRLSQKNIKILTLEYKEGKTVRHTLPSYFFSCLDLTYLMLRNFDFSPTPEFKGFLFLNKLLLYGIHLANNCFEGILSSCPVLQRLLLHGCSGVSHFNISGSKLKRLSIKADDKFESISLEKAPNLTEVFVSLERVVIGLKGNPISDFVKLVNSLPKVKILRLNGNFLQLLAETPVPSMLPTSLKILQLKGVNFTKFDQISAVVCLIRNSPNLEQLYIESSTTKLKHKQVSGYLQLLDCTTFPFRQLHQVKLTNISGFIPEFELIRFLLFSSPSLVTMSIVEHPQLAAEKALEVARKLLQLQPPSPVSIDFSRDGKK
ncbi:F-box/FBD/LRR-repeat protein At1g13570-like [Solanum dulcamara]|uniref:F-box/FBD/LRR-repeat protein At1g13570-like n=1 Tax=Solanum dulcamara TaxID=45834 RepID=UPI0024850560|nr:F-box/FBD/LRR-repeat protein At1g13570-like [Solanum dulcamara]